MINEKTGSVNFIRVSKRVLNLHSDFKEVDKKSIQHLRLSSAFLTDKRPNDIIYHLECIKNDLGADRYEINQ